MRHVRCCVEERARESEDAKEDAKEDAREDGAIHRSAAESFAVTVAPYQHMSLQTTSVMYCLQVCNVCRGMRKTMDGRWREDKIRHQRRGRHVCLRVRVSQSPPTRGDQLADFRTFPNLLHSSSQATPCSDQRCGCPAPSRHTPTFLPRRRVHRLLLALRPAAPRSRSPRSRSSILVRRARPRSRRSSVGCSRRLSVSTTPESSAPTGFTGDRSGAALCEVTARRLGRSR